MLAIIVSWISISIVFLSFGDFLVFLYNKLSKQNERYGVIDTFLLGMCFTLIPLSISSFWLPSNQYILLAYLLLSIIYWVLRKEHFRNLLKQSKQRLQRFSTLQLAAFIIPILAIAIAILWQVGVFDSLFYHQQNIRWNEEFAIVPGLGNLEHRFAFNSNYLLLSSVFSFRFLFGEAVYSLHVLVLVYVLYWILKEIFSSGFELKRLSLLIVFTGYIFVFGYSLASTSTDAIPNIVSFYLIARLLLYPDSIKEKLLFYICIPIILLTFKINILPLSLLSLVAIYYSFKAKQYKSIIISLSTATIIITLRLIRNVIISGYLIFPFSEIDIFTVDWKIPKGIAVEEVDFIKSCAIRIFNDLISHLTTFSFTIEGIKNWLISFIFICPVIISPLVVIYSLIRKKYLNKIIYLAYISLLLIFMIWYIGGPDPRFIGGALFAMFYFVIYLLLEKEEDKHFNVIGTLVVGLFVITMAAWPVVRTNKFTKMFGLLVSRENNKRPISNILIRPYPYKELLRSAGIYKDSFHEYRISSDVAVYISETPEVLDGRYVCFDAPFPCTISASGMGIKYLDVTEIEARGKSLQDGFKAKENN
ncbi:MAG: LIC_10190 family membrane protein [Dysgonomonas sp.]